VHAKCDSYVGVDVSLSLKLTIKKLGRQEEHRREQEIERSKKSGLDKDEDEEAAEEVAQWYYLGFSSFWEMVLNMAVLALLFVFVMNFLQTRGYWDKYFQPPIDKVPTFIPAYRLSPFLSLFFFEISASLLFERTGSRE
jgi:hypothetical protein